MDGSARNGRARVRRMRGRGAGLDATRQTEGALTETVESVACVDEIPIGPSENVLEE